MEFHTYVYIEISRWHSRRHVKEILIGGGCSFESQGEEVGWDSGNWRHFHLGGSRFEFQLRTVLKLSYLVRYWYHQTKSLYEH